jgi:hypothetical protein
MSMSVILLTWCQIQPTSSGIRFVNCGPGHIHCIYSTAYSAFNIHLDVSALLLEISRQFNARYTANLVPNTAHIRRIALCVLWSRTYTMHLQLRIFRLQHSTELSALLLEIVGHVDERYTANLVPNTAHILRYKICELWSRTYTLHLQHRIFSLQYSSRRICAAIGNISTIQCSLYCKLGAKYSAHPPDCAMCTVVPDIYNAFTAPHIQASTFD